MDGSLRKSQQNLYRNILALKERFPWYGTSFKGHKNLHQDSAIEWDYQRKQQNNTAAYIWESTIDPIYFNTGHSSLVFMEIFTSTLPVSFDDSLMKTVEVPQRLVYSMHVFTASRRRWRCFSRWGSCKTPAQSLWRSSPWWCSANANARTGVPGAAPPISAATKAVQTSSVCKSLPLHSPWEQLMDNAEKDLYFCH